jgi:tetratricopeptide (TPR) repeat protein
MAKHVRRLAAGCAVVSALLALTACSSAPRKDDAAAKQATQVRVDERMAAADKALKAGAPDEAVTQLDAAIQADPAAKQPWLKKAQIHFDAHQYGLAIVDAQEVLQRDANDLTAKSILAVSGLRVSASALDDLRKINEVKGSARAEAESVATLIREVLGEPVLVPSPDPDAEAKTRNAPDAAPRRAPRVARPTVATGKRTNPTPTASAPAGARMNPFGALQ